MEGLCREGKKQEADMLAKLDEWRTKQQKNQQESEQANIRYNKEQSRLESLKNIAERYDGYGNTPWI